MIGDTSSELEISQMLDKHPVLTEDISYRYKYINLLEYFVRKYSPRDRWSNRTLDLYKKAFLGNSDYRYNSSNLKRQYKSIVGLKLKSKPFKILSYQYCFIIDCVFINGANNRKKGEMIFSEISSTYHYLFRKRGIDYLFEALYSSDLPLRGNKQSEYLIDCWNKNRTFISEKPIKIFVTAAMSAGKSTLINALVGKKINLTRNDVCTSKIHIIKNKPFEDGYCYKKDYVLNLDADTNTLLTDSARNKSDEIVIGTHFRTIEGKPKRVWLTDTPGVNSSQDKSHKDLAEQSIKEMDIDLLIYLLNCENIGSFDDRMHLQFVLDNYSGKIVFVVNKLDKFRRNEDSVSETLSSVVAELTEIGFESPLVVPVSSLAAYLAKQSIFGETLDEESMEDFDRLSRKLKKDEYQFNTYYNFSKHLMNSIDDGDESSQLLLHSGILQLESIIYGFGG